MTSRTIFKSALLAGVVAILAGSYLLFSGRIGRSWRDTPETWLSFMPADAGLVLYGDFLAARSSPLWALVEAKSNQMPDEVPKGAVKAPSAQRFLVNILTELHMQERCKLEPGRLFDQGLFALNRINGASSLVSFDYGFVFKHQAPPEGLLCFFQEVVRFKADTAILESKYKGRSVYASADRRANLVFLDKHHAVLASDGWLRPIVEVFDRRAPSVAHQELARLIPSVRTSTLWGIAEVPGGHFGADMIGMPSAKSVTFALDLQKGLALQAGLQLEGATSQQDAARLTGLIAKVVDPIRKSPLIQSAALGPYVDPLIVEYQAAANAVQARYALETRQVESLVALLERLPDLGHEPAGPKDEDEEESEGTGENQEEPLKPAERNPSWPAMAPAVRAKLEDIGSDRDLDLDELREQIRQRQKLLRSAEDEGGDPARVRKRRQSGSMRSPR